MLVYSMLLHHALKLQYSCISQFLIENKGSDLFVHSILHCSCDMFWKFANVQQDMTRPAAGTLVLFEHLHQQ